MLRPCTPGRPRRSDATFLPPRDVSTCGWREGRPGTTRTGRDGTGEWRRPGSQRYAVSSSTRCTTVLRVRAYVTLVPTTLAHHGDESDFVGLFNRCGWCRFIVSHAAWHRGFRPVASMLEGFPTKKWTGMIRGTGPFLLSSAGSCLPSGEARSTPCVHVWNTSSPPSTWCTFAYRIDGGFVLRGRYVLAGEYLLDMVLIPHFDYLV